MVAPTPPEANAARSAGARAEASTTRSPAGSNGRSRFAAVRTPLLAGLGAGDLVVRKLNELPIVRGRLNRDELRQRVDAMSTRARRVYGELANRGEDALDRIQRRPEVTRILRRGDQVRARLSTRARSAGEQTARATERSAGAVAGKVERTGDQATQATRQASRDAAGRIAPTDRATEPATRADTGASGNKPGSKAGRGSATGTTTGRRKS